MTNDPLRNDHEKLTQQYEELATLAGGLAHEIRNPLSTIQMNLELLFEDLEASDDPTAHRTLRRLKTIQDQCETLDSTLESFLQFARAGKLNLEEVDLAELVSEFLEFYQAEAEEHHIDVRPHLQSNLPKVALDVRLMNQVLANLFRNSQQAMPDGGVIEVQTSREGDFVVLELIDTGSGMSPQALDKVFQVFFSTKPNGSGLGLPTVRKIIEVHGGTIDCNSAPGRGTKFKISLPLSSSRSVNGE